jgi:putative ABC transport system permease protein
MFIIHSAETNYLRELGSMFKYLPLVWSSLQRHKLRTVFTVASVVVAFLLFGVLSAVRNGFGGGTQFAGADRLMTTHKVSFIQPLPLSYLARIRSIPGVRSATHATWYGGIYRDNRTVLQVMPVDPESYLEVYTDVKLPPDARKRWLDDRSSAIIGRAYAKKFGWKVGDMLPIRSDLFRRTDGSDAWQMKVAGIFDQGDSDAQGIYFHYDYFNESRSMGRDYVGWYIVKIDNPDNATKIGAAIDAQFANSSAETKTTTEEAFGQAFANQIGNVGTIVIAVASAVFFTMLLVTANTMSQSVRERRSELGVLKTLGFVDRSILWLVLAEALLTTVLGGAIGLSAAFWLVKATADMFGQFFGAVVINGAAVFIGIALMILLGLIAGALPAVQALRLQIVDALRRE